MSAADLATPIRNAVIGNSAITTLLTDFNGGEPVFTRRPAPTGAAYPIIMISPDITISDNDGIDDYRPVQTRDVTVYGSNESAAHYRTVEEIGYMLREMFHSKRLSITVPGWNVVQINASGPIPAPVDDDKTVARMVSLQIQLARL